MKEIDQELFKSIEKLVEQVRESLDVEDMSTATRYGKALYEKVQDFMSFEFLSDPSVLMDLCERVQILLAQEMERDEEELEDVVLGKKLVTSEELEVLFEKMRGKYGWI